MIAPREAVLVPLLMIISLLYVLVNPSGDYSHQLMLFVLAGTPLAIYFILNGETYSVLRK